MCSFNTGGLAKSKILKNSDRQYGVPFELEVLTPERLEEARATVESYFQERDGKIDDTAEKSEIGEVNRAACELAAAKYYSFPKDRLKKFKEALEWKGDAET